MGKAKYILIGASASLVLSGTLFFSLTPVGRSIINNWTHALNKVDEKNYETRKKVEDQCRSMIASYEADKLAYYQYRDSESELEKTWAQGYKQRANQTAAIYNEYILKNSYVWEDNVPSDIVMSLPYITD